MAGELPVPDHAKVFDEAPAAFLLLTPDFVRDRDDARLQAARGERWREQVQRVEADPFARTRELEALNAQLHRSGERERRTARRLTALAATASALGSAETVEEVAAALCRHGRTPLGSTAALLALRDGPGAPLRLVDGVGGRLAGGAGVPAPAHRRAAPRIAAPAVGPGAGVRRGGGRTAGGRRRPVRRGRRAGGAAGGGAPGGDRDAVAGRGAAALAAHRAPAAGRPAGGGALPAGRAGGADRR